MLKKIIALAMVGCFVFLNTACDLIGGNKTKLDPENPVTITLWHYYFDEKEQILNDFVEEFNSTVGAEKGIIVAPINKGRIIDLEKTLTDSANGVVNSEKMPNIFSAYIDKAVELSNLNKIVDLNEYYSPEEKKGFIGSFVEAGTFDNKFMVLPIVKSTEVLYVNKTKWDEIKAVTNHKDEDLETWEGISKAAEDYQHVVGSSTGQDIKGFFGYESLENFILLAMKEQGVDVIDGENKLVHLNEPELKKFFQMYFSNMINKRFYVEGKFRNDNLQTGTLVSYTGSIAGAKYFPTVVFEKDKEKPIEMLALRYPTFEGMKGYGMLQGAGMAVAKASDAEVEASVEFLKWFTKDVNNLEFATRTAYLPSRKGLYEGKAFQNTINKLKKESVQAEHLARIYEIGRDVVLNGESYYVKPFEKSYKVREILGETLKARVDEVLADPKKYKDSTVDAQFEIWVKNVKEELERNEIQYE